MLTESEIVVDRVSKTYGERSRVPVVALHETALAIGRGKFVCIVGPSGCGKSTLLLMVAGLIKPTTGSIRVGGAAVTGPGPERGLVFQEYGLFPWLTVRGNIAFRPDWRGAPRDARGAPLEEDGPQTGPGGFREREPDGPA